MSKHQGLLIAAFLGMTITGCSSGASTSGTATIASIPKTPATAGASASPGTSASPSSSLATGKVTISFKIPSKATSQSAARRQYISASTASLTVGVDGGSPSATTANCASQACSATLNLSAGSHTLAVRLWDAANGGGNELASNTGATCSVTVNTANTCSITMYGFAASLKISTTSSNISGSQATGFDFVTGVSTPFTVVALDADGNQITGTGAIVPALSTSASGVTLATPAPGSPNSWSIDDTNGTAQTVAIASTPAPNSDGAPLSANVSMTGASLYAGSLYFFSGSNFDVVSATTGQTTLSIANPVSGAPMAAATQNYVLLNAAGSATNYIFDLNTDAITSTIATGCSSSDNVPVAADSGLFFYDCSGTVHEYNTSGTAITTWADQESNTGFVAAGGGYVYTISGTTIHVFNDSGVQQGTFTVAAAPSPQWSFAASAQGLFITTGTTARQYSSTGTLVTSFTVGTASCDIQPVGNYLTVRTGPTAFTTYSLATGQSLGTIQSSATPSDCRVGFSN